MLFPILVTPSFLPNLEAFLPGLAVAEAPAAAGVGVAVASAAKKQQIVFFGGFVNVCSVFFQSKPTTIKVKKLCDEKLCE